MFSFILDTDPGIDDTYALLYALADDALDLRGVTTIFGNVQTETATNNALWLLEKMGRPDIAVAQGAARALHGRAHVASVAVHGADGFGNWPAQQPKGQPVPEDAADFMIAQSRLLPGQLHIVAVGPLTNLALAAQRDPDFPKRIASLHVMGGAFRARGNVTPFAEANIHNDPEAAQVVAQSYPNLRFIGLDVTDRIPLPMKDCNELAECHPQWRDFLREIAAYYTAFYASVGKTAGASLHDPATLIALARPELFTFEPGQIEVLLEGEERGRTLLAPSSAQSGVDAAIRGDYDTIRADFLQKTQAFLRRLPV